MKTCMSGCMAVALAFTGWLASPAFAGDDPAPGGTSKPAAEAKGSCHGEDKGSCCGKEGGCGKEGECGKESKECVARRNLETVALAAVEGECEAAKNVLAQVPEQARQKVEEMRKATFEFLVMVQKEMQGLKKDFTAACDQAKADGKEMACDFKATYEGDMKALHVKGKEKLDAFAKTLDEAIGSEKVQSLAAEVKKVGEAAKSCALKIKAAAAKILASEEQKTGEEPAKEAPAKDCKSTGQ